MYFVPLIGLLPDHTPDHGQGQEHAGAGTPAPTHVVGAETGSPSDTYVVGPELQEVYPEAQGIPKAGQSHAVRRQTAQDLARMTRFR